MKDRECLVCWKPTNDSFWCPCDLEHPICSDCKTRVPRLDCAYIWSGRGHYVTRTGFAG